VDDFTKYRELRDQGWSAQDVYRSAQADGFDAIALIRLVRGVFGLSLVEAKEVKVLAEGLAPSLAVYQEQLVPVQEQALQCSSNGNGLADLTWNAACKKMHEG